MTTLEYLAIAGIAYAAVSEIIGLLPIRENSVVQMVLKIVGTLLGAFTPKR